MKNMQSCLSRIERFLESGELGPGLDATRPFIRAGISEGVDQACRFADENGFTDKQAIAAMFRDELYAIINNEDEFRSKIQEGLRAGVQEARQHGGGNKEQVDGLFRQILDEVLKEKLGC